MFVGATASAGGGFRGADATWDVSELERWRRKDVFLEAALAADAVGAMCATAAAGRSSFFCCGTNLTNGAPPALGSSRGTRSKVGARKLIHRRADRGFELDELERDPGETRDLVADPPWHVEALAHELVTRLRAAGSATIVRPCE